MSVAVASPRLGFLGVGWIGRNRMEAVARAGAGAIAAVAEPDRGLREAAAALAPGTAAVASLDELLELDPTPLYTHAFPLEDLQEAMRTMRDRPDGFLKALVVT